ncbi:endonuclease domain-containing protein [Streptomyces massasporeus]|uniref:endonuclease domain-containing protein n=1 Tax=Streptomyces massasporeus TaxID=67324 RepID=UPI0033DABEFE
MRTALVDAIGPDCHLCGLYPGAMVDHDHETGLVRGLLCVRCSVRGRLPCSQTHENLCWLE